MFYPSLRPIYRDIPNELEYGVVRLPSNGVMLKLECPHSRKLFDLPVPAIR
jgi:hypothetical protein